MEDGVMEALDTAVGSSRYQFFLAVAVAMATEEAQFIVMATNWSTATVIVFMGVVMDTVHAITECISINFFHIYLFKYFLYRFIHSIHSTQ